MGLDKVINIIIKAVDQTERGLTRPIQMSDLLKGKTDALKKSINDLTPAFKLAASSALVGGAVMVQSSLNSADAFSKATQSTGLTIERLSGYAHGAKMAGVENDAFIKTMEKFSENVSKASAGTGEQAEAFEALGISVTDSSGKLKTNEQLLREVAERFHEMPDGAHKSELAVKLFSKTGEKMIPFLNAGAKGLDEMYATADRLGQVFDEKTGKAAEAFNDNMTLLKDRVTGAANRVAAGLAPALAALTDQTDAAAPSMEGVVAVLKSVMSVGMVAAEVFNQIARNLAGTVAVAAGFVDSGLDGAKAAWDAWKQDSVDSFGDMADRLKKMWANDVPAAADEGAKKREAIDVKALQKAEAAAKKRAEAEKKALEQIETEYAKATLDKLALIDREYDERIKSLRDTYGETKAVLAAIEKLEYMRAERLESLYNEERERVDELQRQALEASGDKLAALEAEHQAARDRTAAELSDAQLRADALAAIDQTYAKRRADIEKQAADEAVQVARSAHELELELRAERLDGYEAEREKVLETYQARLDKIAELEAAGLSNSQASILRIEAEKSADAALWEARMANLEAFNAARTAAENALTAGMLASYEVLFAKQSAGEKKLADEKADVRRQIAAIEEQQLLSKMTAEQRAAYEERKQVEALAKLKQREHELEMKRTDRATEAVKTLWLTFRDEFTKAIVQTAAKAAAQWLIMKLAGAAIAAAWAPAAVSASVATLGGAAAEGTLAYTGALAAGKAEAMSMSTLHGGQSFIPYDEASFLQKGERVVSKRQNEDLTAALEDGRVGAGAPTQVVVMLDGEVLGRGVGKLSRDGRLEIAAGAVR